MLGPRCSLEELATRARRSRSYQALRDGLMDDLGRFIPSRAWAVYAFSGSDTPEDVAVRGLPDRFVLRYEELGRDIDPVMSAVMTHRAPVHTLVGRTVEEWRQEPLYRRVAKPHGLENFITVPVFAGRGLRMTLHMGRGPDDPPYAQGELIAACGLATELALLCQQARWSEGVQLTRREREVSELVAKGLTNPEVARCLAISRDTVKAVLKRLFVKLEVTTRTEMVLELYRTGMLDGDVRPRAQ